MSWVKVRRAHNSHYMTTTTSKTMMTMMMTQTARTWWRTITKAKIKSEKLSHESIYTHHGQKKRLRTFIHFYIHMLIRLFSILRSVRTPFFSFFLLHMCVELLHKSPHCSLSVSFSVWVCRSVSGEKINCICLATSFKFCAFILQWFILYYDATTSLRGGSFHFNSIRYIAWENFKI